MDKPYPVTNHLHTDNVWVYQEEDGLWRFMFNGNLTEGKYQTQDEAVLAAWNYDPPLHRRGRRHKE